MNINVTKLAPYAKTVVAVLGLLLLVAKACVDGQLNSTEISEIAIAAGVALGVYQVPNKQ